MGGGLESNCVGRVYGADGARTVNTTYAAPLNIYIYIYLIDSSSLKTLLF